MEQAARCAAEARLAAVVAEHTALQACVAAEAAANARQALILVDAQVGMESAPDEKRRWFGARCTSIE